MRRRNSSVKEDFGTVASASGGRLGSATASTADGKSSREMLRLKVRLMLLILLSRARRAACGENGLRGAASASFCQASYSSSLEYEDPGLDSGISESGDAAPFVISIPIKIYACNTLGTNKSACFAVMERGGRALNRFSRHHYVTSEIGRRELLHATAQSALRCPWLGCSSRTTCSLFTANHVSFQAFSIQTRSDI